jgi:hypothetical protein
MISWTDPVRNEVSRSQEGEEYPTYNGSLFGLVVSCMECGFRNTFSKE